MDASVIVAAVGSFVVSERVLKPKATALFLLGCVLVYDLTTKTHDTTSLRVYRGTCVSNKSYMLQYVLASSSLRRCCLTDTFSLFLL